MVVMVKPFDPEEGIFFNYETIFGSIDDKIPGWIRFEVERTAIDELGWSTRAAVVEGAPASALMIYTAALEGGNIKVGRLVLSPRRWRVSSEMAHNVYIRYTRKAILQFFFHAGWDKESTRYFIREFRSQLLSTKAWNPRYKMTVRELVSRVRDVRLSGFWRVLKRRGDHDQ